MINKETNKRGFYKSYAFRISEETNNELKKLAVENNLSKNQLFIKMIKLTKKYGNKRQ